MDNVREDIRRLSRADLPVDTAALARYLIGKTIVRTVGKSRLSGRIVETEAYPPGDSSGHAYRGQTASNKSLFLGRGFAYVYFTYGMHFMLNVTAEEPGVGAGVLVRALEPLEGIDVMARHWGWGDCGHGHQCAYRHHPRGRPIAQILRGGKPFCQWPESPVYEIRRVLSRFQLSSPGGNSKIPVGGYEFIETECAI
jgi:hypothetical protein